MSSSTFSDVGDVMNTPSTTHPKAAEVDRNLLSRYMVALDEGYSGYERFFDALLIKRVDQPEFFHDLRCFRAQLNIIDLFTTCKDEKPDYREISEQYLASHFAHPWCRSALLKEGWNKAEWGKSRRSSIIQEKEEDKLHRLLVPVWIRFRKHMHPSEEFLQRFADWETESAKTLVLQKEREKEQLRMEAKKVKSGLHEPENTVDGGILNNRSHQPEKERATSTQRVESMDWDDEEDDLPRPLHSDKHTAEDEAGPATAIAKLFVGMATAGVILENKRARKYLLKKWGKPSK